MEVDRTRSGPGKKVLVIGPEFYNYLDNIVLMFSDAGWSVSTVGYRIESARNPVKRIVNRRKTRLLQKQINEKINNEHFDLCVQVRGYDRLDIDTYRAISSMGIPMVLFLQDSITKLNLNKACLELFSRILTFESSDEQYFANLGLGEKVVYFGVAYHPFYYFKYPAQKKYDICFAGNIHKNDRYELLNNLCAQFPHFKILLITPFVSWKSPSSLLKYIKYPHKKNVMSGEFGPEVINRAYNESRIVLNLQDPQNIVNFNPRTVEIWASGSFQLSKSTASLKAIDDLDVIALYESEEDLFVKCAYYLEHPDERKRIEQNGLVFAKNFVFEKHLEKFLI